MCDALQWCWKMRGILVEEGSARCVDENIKKARRAFFNFGSIGVFQGSLNPLSSATVIETCVMPILLYGAGNWIFTSELLKRLESFQGELAKRVLWWPGHHTSACIAVGFQSTKSRVLGQKLSFLQHARSGRRV